MKDAAFKNQVSWLALCRDFCDVLNFHPKVSSKGCEEPANLIGTMPTNLQNPAELCDPPKLLAKDEYIRKE